MKRIIDYLKLALFAFVVSASVISCSNDEFFGFEDDYNNEFTSFSNNVTQKRLFCDQYIDIDLSCPFEGVEKEKPKYEEAIRRITSKCIISDGKISLSHTTADELNINKEFFELFKSLIESIDTVPSFLTNKAFPRSRDYNPETIYWEGFFIVYCACIAAMSSDIERKCFNQYWFARGDLTLTNEEWNGGIKQYAETQIGSNVICNSTLAYNGTTYYLHLIHYGNNSDYNYCFGDATVTFSSNGYACGFYDYYNFDSKPLGTRPDIAELITRLVNVFGHIYFAKNYKITYGIHKYINQ